MPSATKQGSLNYQCEQAEEGEVWMYAGCQVRQSPAKSPIINQCELAQEGGEKSGYMLGASPSEAVSSQVAC